MSGTSNITSTYSKEGGGRRRLRLPRLRPALPAPRQHQHGGRKSAAGSIENGKIAGHASTAITEEYTLVRLHRHDELTRRILAKRAKAATKGQEGRRDKKEVGGLEAWWWQIFRAAAENETGSDPRQVAPAPVSVIWAASVRRATDKPRLTHAGQA